MKKHVYPLFIHIHSYQEVILKPCLFLKMLYMLSINETYVFMNFDLLVVQVYKDL
jgi:hypothetical protein